MNVAPEVTPQSKAFATLAARCALAGYALVMHADGRLFVSKWGLGTWLDDEAALEVWLARAAPGAPE